MTEQEQAIYELELRKNNFIESEKRKLMLKVKNACIKDKGELMRLQLEFYERSKYSILPSEFLTLIQVIYCFKIGIEDYEKEYEENKNRKLSTG